MATDRVKRAQQAFVALEEKNKELTGQIEAVQKSLDKQNATMGRLVLQGGDVDKLATEITQLDAKKRVLIAAQAELQRQVAEARVELQAAQREAAQQRVMQIAEEADRHAEAYRTAARQALAELDALVGLQVEAHALCNSHGVAYPGQSFAMAVDAMAFRNSYKSSLESLETREKDWVKAR